MSSRIKFPDKPWAEPFREWNLENCDHCGSYQPLATSSCSRCGFPRSQYDQNMANQVQSWRASPWGQEAWNLYLQEKDQKQKETETTRRWALACFAVVAFVPAFLAWGLIGMIGGHGLLVGTIGGLVTSWLIWPKDPT